MEEYENCTTRHYLNTVKETCGCLPFNIRNEKVCHDFQNQYWLVIFRSGFFIYKLYNNICTLNFLQGVRASTVDACQHHDPCQNGGICISTDGGPICECSYIDFDGVYCGQSKLCLF